MEIWNVTIWRIHSVNTDSWYLHCGADLTLFCYKDSNITHLVHHNRRRCVTHASIAVVVSDIPIILFGSVTLVAYSYDLWWKLRKRSQEVSSLYLLVVTTQFLDSCSCHCSSMSTYTTQEMVFLWMRTDCKCLSSKVHRKNPLLPSHGGIPSSRSSIQR
jgi:hypothetical protein